MISTRIKEHQSAVRLGHVTQSALAEHRVETGHKILFEETSILAKTSAYFPRKHREALENYKNPDNLNRDCGLKTNRNWHTIVPTQ